MSKLKHTTQSDTQATPRRCRVPLVSGRAGWFDRVDL